MLLIPPALEEPEPSPPLPDRELEGGALGAVRAVPDWVVVGVLPEVGAVPAVDAVEDVEEPEPQPAAARAMARQAKRARDPASLRTAGIITAPA